LAAVAFGGTLSSGVRAGDSTESTADNVRAVSDSAKASDSAISVAQYIEGLFGNAVASDNAGSEITLYAQRDAARAADSVGFTYSKHGTLMDALMAGDDAYPYTIVGLENISVVLQLARTISFTVER